jgi:metal-responsive CopG/Arc/MetJ family transcriptional regulator
MPNQPATTIRGIRIPDELWEEAKAIAHDEGFASASEMVRDCLERRVAEHRRKQEKAGET